MVQILPMRDWNQKKNRKNSKKSSSSDLTYEGLKLGVVADNSIIIYSSDLTYEGLKPFFTAPLIPSAILVQILPMRDWNSSTRQMRMHRWVRSDLTYEGLKLRKPTINCCKDWLFRSYLWGIETIQEDIETQKKKQFRSYLWGIETGGHIQCYNRACWFRSYLWGIETAIPFKEEL